MNANLRKNIKKFLKDWDDTTGDFSMWDYVQFMNKALILLRKCAADGSINKTKIKKR
jgi:hypothetical protein